MIFGKRKNGNNDVPNIMEMIPERTQKWEFNEEKGRVDIIQPRFKSSWLSKLVPPKKDPNIYIHLDELGTYFWQLIDGKRTVTEIGMAMMEKFPDKFTDGLERIGLFARELYRHGFINVQLPDKKEN